MTEPKSLRVGDKIKYVKRPYEWNRNGYRISDDDKLFVDLLISKDEWQAIDFIDEFGNPWISISITDNNTVEHHTWAIFENSGWIRMSAQQPITGHTADPLNGPDHTNHD